MPERPAARPLWHGKPYYSLDAYCRNTYSEKLYKIAVDAGMTCPNRDGTKGSRGCIFCSQGGSGDFAVKCTGRSVTEQIREGLSLFREKKTGSRFIAYFQAYTNTYAPPARLRALYTQALAAPETAGISVATRPDCLPEEVLSLLAELQRSFPDKFIWIELGLQTVHDKTADYIRRGYPLSCFTQAVHALNRLRIPVIVHIILGLPGETDSHVYETIDFLNSLPVSGIKLQLLHILQHTDLADEYARGAFTTLTLEHYTDLVIRCLERLRPDIVIHRLTGDGPRDLLIAPRWSLDKRKVLNTIHRKMNIQNTFQGKYCQAAGKEHNDTGCHHTL